MTLYRINYGDNDWNALGVVGEEGESLGVLVEVEPTDLLCIEHGATRRSPTECWVHAEYEWADADCVMVDVVRVTKEDS